MGCLALKDFKYSLYLLLFDCYSFMFWWLHTQLSITEALPFPALIYCKPVAAHKTGLHRRGQ